MVTQLVLATCEPVHMVTQLVLATCEPVHMVTQLVLATCEPVHMVTQLVLATCEPVHMVTQLVEHRPKPGDCMFVSHPSKRIAKYWQHVNHAVHMVTQLVEHRPKPDDCMFVSHPSQLQLCFQTALDVLPCLVCCVLTEVRITHLHFIVWGKLVFHLYIHL